MEKIQIRRDRHSGSAILIAIHDRHIGEKSSRPAPFLQGRVVDVRSQGHPLQALVVLVGAVERGVARLLRPHQRQQRGGRLSGRQRQSVQRKILGERISYLTKIYVRGVLGETNAQGNILTINVPVL
jgi:hypothetical protein